MLNGLGKFELARRLLNHVAVVPLTAPYLQAVRCTDCGPTPEELAAYAVDLRAAQNSETHEGFPDPVIPVVDIAHLAVTHTSCTGNTTILVDSWGTFRWMRHAPTSDHGVRDRLLAGLDSNGYYWEDPARRVFLDVEDWEAAGLEPMEAGARLVAHHHGVYALYRIGLEDRLYTADAVVSDYDAMPEDGDAWMPAISSELRAKILADYPDSVLVEG